jgi:uncharacterized lipoprotein
MNFDIHDYEETDPILNTDWAKVPAIRKIGWSARDISVLLRMKLIVGIMTSNRKYMITKAEMRKALAIYQRNTGSEEPIRFD